MIIGQPDDERGSWANFNHLQLCRQVTGMDLTMYLVHLNYNVRILNYYSYYIIGMSESQQKCPYAASNNYDDVSITTGDVVKYYTSSKLDHRLQPRS